MSVTRCCGSLPPEQSITNSLFGTPTCTAASPTPGAAYIVSNILLTSLARSASNSVTGSAGVSSTGDGHFTISNKAIRQFYNEPQKGTKVTKEEVLFILQILLILSNLSGVSTLLAVLCTL